MSLQLLKFMNFFENNPFGPKIKFKYKKYSRFSRLLIVLEETKKNSLAKSRINCGAKKHLKYFFKVFHKLIKSTYNLSNLQLYLNIESK